MNTQGKSKDEWRVSVDKPTNNYRENVFLPHRLEEIFKSLKIKYKLIP